MNAIQLFRKDGEQFKNSNVWYCEACKVVYSDEGRASLCCVPATCEVCQSPVEEKYYTMCKHCRMKKKEKRLAVRYELSEKLGAEYGGPVYSDEFSENNGYFSSLGDLFDAREEEEWPEYVWACTTSPLVHAHTGSIIDDLEYPEDQGPEILDGIEELKTALKAFNEVNKTHEVWHPDYTRSIHLDRFRKEKS